MVGEPTFQIFLALVVAGSTLDEVKQLIREAIDFHLEGMREHGDPIPEPSVVTEYVSVN